ncbi:11852_t:CDS:2 [Entrophospora sp. SA101]|nr:11852_t:CDS:2 [Entrophospora sp. SA101]CAJ0912683.1 4497_t:CDS:2 [Entrophospora sp. SA101]
MKWQIIFTKFVTELVIELAIGKQSQISSDTIPPQTFDKSSIFLIVGGAIIVLGGIFYFVKLMRKEKHKKSKKGNSGGNNGIGNVNNNNKRNSFIQTYGSNLLNTWASLQQEEKVKKITAADHLEATKRFFSQLFQLNNDNRKKEEGNANLDLLELIHHPFPSPPPLSSSSSLSSISDSPKFGNYKYSNRSSNDSNSKTQKIPYSSRKVVKSYSSINNHLYSNPNINDGDDDIYHYSQK